MPISGNYYYGDGTHERRKILKTHPTALHLEALYLALERPGRNMLIHLAGCARCRERVTDLLRQQNSRPDEPDGPRGPRGPDVPDDPTGTLYSRALPPPGGA
jgi:hypothetical protein